MIADTPPLQEISNAKYDAGGERDTLWDLGGAKGKHLFSLKQT
jgi:hypothetical protein